MRDRALFLRSRPCRYADDPEHVWSTFPVFVRKRMTFMEFLRYKNDEWRQYISHMQ